MVDFCSPLKAYITSVPAGVAVGFYVVDVDVVASSWSDVDWYIGSLAYN